jgi:hypothetical protein
LVVTAALVSGGVGGWLAMAAGFAALGVMIGPVVGAFRPGRV